LWIRVRRQFLESLPRALGDCEPASVAGLVEPGPGSATPATTAFRYTGSRDLYLTDGFQRGQFEIQDLASQLVGWACNPQPGETWWDACAGEGGKMLHLADLMQNKGLIWVSDRSMRRLKILKQRAARSGVFNYRAVPWNGGPQPPTRTRFDGILVDAPCSGVGTWQRNPHARWTISPTDVRELAAVQRQLLDHVVGALKPGGRLIYAVCTLTRAETSRVAAEFSRSHPELEPVPVFPTAGIPVQASEGQPTGTEPPRPMNDACSGSVQISGAGQSDFMGGTPMPCGTGAPPVGSSERLDPDLRPSGSPVAVQFWPQELKANGMFIAAWRLQSARLQST
jgi:16S rRNA (cytosine967-C5)-methyltransferase